jgi:hypothetical protein
MRPFAAVAVLAALASGCSNGTHTSACSANDLGVFVGFGSGGGAMIGEVSMRNRGPTACTLDGRPVVAMLDGRGHPLPVRLVKSTAGKPIEVRPDEQASVHFQWRNWCEVDFPPRVTMRLSLPARGGAIRATAALGRPRCDAQRLPSTLQVGPFIAGA